MDADRCSSPLAILTLIYGSSTLPAPSARSALLSELLVSHAPPPWLPADCFFATYVCDPESRIDGTSVPSIPLMIMSTYETADMYGRRISPRHA